MEVRLTQFCVFFTMSFSCSGMSQQDLGSLEDKKELRIDIHNNHKIEVNNNQAGVACRGYTGTKLKDCMSCLSRSDYQCALREMDCHGRRHFSNQLSYAQLADVRTFFSNEEWEQLRAIDYMFVRAVELAGQMEIAENKEKEGAEGRMMWTSIKAAIFVLFCG